MSVFSTCSLPFPCPSKELLLVPHTHVPSVLNMQLLPFIFCNHWLFQHASVSKNGFPMFWSQELSKIPTLVVSWARRCWEENFLVTWHHQEQQRQTGWEMDPVCFSSDLSVWWTCSGDRGACPGEQSLDSQPLGYTSGDLGRFPTVAAVWGWFAFAEFSFKWSSVKNS